MVWLVLYTPILHLQFVVTQVSLFPFTGGRLWCIKLIVRLSADVIVHRLLEACIDADLTYGQELTDKMKMKELCDSKYT